MQLTCAAKRCGVAEGGGTDVTLRVWLIGEVAAATAEAEAADMFAWGAAETWLQAGINLKG